MGIPARFTFGVPGSGGTMDNPTFTTGWTSGNLVFTDAVPGNPSLASQFTDGSAVGTLWDAATFQLRDTSHVPKFRVDMNSNTMGFFGTDPVAKPTGVAVSAAGVHAALVTLGLIAA